MNKNVGRGIEYIGHCLLGIQIYLAFLGEYFGEGKKKKIFLLSELYLCGGKKSN